VSKARPKIESIEGELYYDAHFLARRYHVHPMTIWKWRSKHVLPAPVRLAANTTRWRGSDILDFELKRQEA
jgi:hypothetical protein